jgi:penicillin-binding protein 1B
VKVRVPYRKGVFIFLVICAVLAVSGIIYASFDAGDEIRKLKEGPIWHIPSRIYSRPLRLAPGVDINRMGLMGRLDRLRYRSVSKITRPGEYARSAGAITLFIHDFSHAGEEHKAARVRLLIQDGRITGVVKPGTNVSLGSALLEPEIITQIYDDLYEDRTIVKLNDCPRVLTNAIMCTEDRRFYSHHGVDIRSVFRAGISNIRHGEVTEGGSTITQQLVKNLFLNRKRVMSRKVKEIWIALAMEREYSKDQILEMYINEIYMGSYNHAGVCGMGRAARVLFDKNISDLTLPEAALMAGMIKAPNAYSPYNYPDKALARRNLVLSLMLEQGKITAKDCKKAKKTPLRVVAVKPRKRQAPYFVDYILNSVRAQFPETVLQQGGYQIYTTLDMHMQNTAEVLLARNLGEKEKGIDGSVVVMDPRTGEILAMVGGKDYGVSQFNRAVSIRRQIGSLAKPIVYYTALKSGYTLTSFLDDSPVSLPQADGTNWEPSNFDKIPHGRVMLRDALAHSYNLATVHLGLNLGVANVLLELGKVLPFTVSNTNPSVLLGAMECSPMEVSSLYSAFANNGNQVRPYALKAVADEGGAVIQAYPPTFPAPVLDPAVVYLLDDALREAVISGTAHDSKLYGMPQGACGKTGTTDDARDSWFVGFTPQMVVTVWLGADKYRSIGYTGAAGAMPIAAGILGRLSPPADWPLPQGVIMCSVDPENGKLANYWTSGGIKVPYLSNTQPMEVTETGPDVPVVREIPKVFDYLKNLLFNPSR